MNALRSPRLLVLTLLLTLWASGCSREAKRDRALRRAQSYLADEQYEKAGLELQNVLRLDPTNQTARLQMARVFFEQGSPLRAMQVIQTGGGRLEDPVLRCRVAEFKIGAGDRVGGRNELVGLLSQSPTNREALLALAGSTLTPQEATNTLAYLRQFDSKYPNAAPLLLAQGVVLARMGQFPSAEQFVQRALQADPKLAQAHIHQAQLLLMHSNVTAAEKAFETGVQLAPYRSPIRLADAQRKAGSGRTEEARAAVAEILKHAPDYLPAILMQARLETQERKFDQALALTTRVLARDPFSLETRQLRTQLYAAKGEPEKAVIEWEQFDKDLPGNPLIKSQLAQAYLANSEAAKAGTAAEQAIRLSSNRLDVLDIQSRLLRARADLETQNPAGAVEVLRTLLTRTNVIEGRLLLVDAFRAAGKMDDAIATSRALARDIPDNARLPVMLGMLERERGRSADANTAFRRSLELSPGNLMAMYQIVDLELAATNAPAALKLVEAELARTNSAPLRYLQGRAFSAQKQWPQAEQAFRQSLELNPDFSLSYQSLAQVYLANTNLAGAAKELEGLVSRRTNDLASAVVLATVYERLGQTERARDRYEQLIKLNPRFVPPYNNLAYIYTERLPQLDRALELATKARQLAPEDPSIADTLGWVYYKRGEHAKALPLLKEAGERAAASAEIQYHLGMASYMAGQTDVARAALQRALASPEQFSGRTEAQKQLALLTQGAATAVPEDRAALEKLVKEQPRDLTARGKLAERYELDKQPALAVAEYEEILRQNPRAAGVALRLARLNAGPLANPAKAFEWARKARDLAPTDVEAAGLFGRLAFQRGEQSQALAALQSAIQTAPRRGDLQYWLGWAAYSVGRVAEGEKAIRQSLELDAQGKEAEAARAFLAMGDLVRNPAALAAGEASIQRVLAADPNHVPALMAQAALLRTRGTPKAAIPAYEKAVATFPRFTPAIRELGLLLAADPAQQARANELLGKVREASADDLEVARALALLSYQRKDYQYATTLWQSYVRSRSDDPEALYYLGMSLVQTRQVAAGRAQLEKAIAGGLKEPLLAEAKKALSAAPAK